MGNCEREAELTDWVLSELPLDQARELELHVSHCAGCARAATQLRRLQQALMMNLKDRDMPARLVFAGLPQHTWLAGFWGSLVRTAAPSAAGAAIFLAVMSLGFELGISPFLRAARGQSALTRAEITALATQAAAQQVGLERKQTESAMERLEASLQQKQAGDVARVARQLDYMELSQSTVWKEIQQHNEVVNFLARNYLRPASLSAPPEQR